MLFLILKNFLQPLNLFYLQDLRVIVDQARHGVIVFSLGTNVRSDKLTVEQKSALVQAFAMLPYTVIWKFESEYLEEIKLPVNVIIRKWLPQNDLLGTIFKINFINK